VSSQIHLQREGILTAYLTTCTEKTLLRQSQTAALETPSRKVLEAFNREFYDNNSAILGYSKHIYEDKGSNIQDLAQLHSTERKDRVSTFLSKHMFNWLQVRRLLNILIWGWMLKAESDQHNN
jgi:hypothetical protein